MTATTIHSIRRLVRFDMIAAATAGTLVILLKDFITTQFLLPVEVLVGQGVIALIYSLYGFFLIRRKEISKGGLKILALANIAYALVVLGILFTYAGDLTVLGKISLGIEFVFVFALGVYELYCSSDRAFHAAAK